MVVGWGGHDDNPRQKAVENAIDFFGRQPAFKEWEKHQIYQLLSATDIVPGNLTGKVATFAVIIKKRDLIDPATGRTVFSTLKPFRREFEEVEEGDYSRILCEAVDGFNDLPLFHDGDSRQIRELPEYPSLLIQKLKPTAYSFVADGAVEVDAETAKLRVLIDAHILEVLEDAGIWMSNLAHQDDYILMRREPVATQIEVVVKGALVGSPKHLYKGIEGSVDRFGNTVKAGESHNPYVRFDWRIPPPGDDIEITPGRAKSFIDTQVAEKTALEAYDVLKVHFACHDMDLKDGCFFMTKDGYTICGEVSPDNLGNIEYTGDTPEIRAIFEDRSKENFVNKLKEIAKLLGL